MTASLTVDGPPEQVVGRGVSPNFLAVLGVTPQLGRSITEEEDRTGAQVVMISHRLWQRRYGGDPSVVGKTMTMNDAKYEIVAVLPRTFVFSDARVATTGCRSTCRRLRPRNGVRTTCRPSPG